MSSFTLPHINTTEHGGYTHYYNTETRKLVEKAYAEDIDLFEYRWAND